MSCASTVVRPSSAAVARAAFMIESSPRRPSEPRARQRRVAISSASGAANVFATTLNAASERVERASVSAADALEETARSGARAKASLLEIGEAATVAAEQIAPAADQLGRLGSTADEGATLVNGLRDLIAAVEQFIPSGRSGSSR